MTPTPGRSARGPRGRDPDSGVVTPHQGGSVRNNNTTKMLKDMAFSWTAPARSLEIWHQQVDADSVNVMCRAEGVAPRPRLQLLRYNADVGFVVFFFCFFFPFFANKQTNKPTADRSTSSHLSKRWRRRQLPPRGHWVGWGGVGVGGGGWTVLIGRLREKEASMSSFRRLVGYRPIKPLPHHQETGPIRKTWLHFFFSS